MQIKISEIKNNPANPRTIRDKQFSDLKRSIAQFPAMLAKRPIAAVKDGKKWMAIGGNQRTRALLDLQKEIEDYEGFLRLYECTAEAAAILTKYFVEGVPVVDCTDLSPDEQRRFIIADNLPFGEWDTEALANEWDVEELKDWGMPELSFSIYQSGQGDYVNTSENGAINDYSDKNKEIDVNDFGNTMIMKFTFSEEEYHFVLNALSGNKEQELLKILNYEAPV